MEEAERGMPHFAVVSPVLCVFISTTSSRICPAGMHVLLFLHTSLLVSILTGSASVGIRTFICGGNFMFCRMAVPRVTCLLIGKFMPSLARSVSGSITFDHTVLSYETYVVCRDAWCCCAFANNFLICRIEMVSKPLLIICSYML